ncbi:hypothetical protein EMCRGX_G017167 [Ephydatia muelleri]
MYDDEMLRLRVKAMQHTIDSQSERLAVLQAIQKAASISHDESTGQGVLCVLVVLYFG